MRIFTTLVACAMSIGASSLAHAQSMGKPRTAPAAAAADTQHMAPSDSTAKKAGRMQSPAAAAKHDQMGKNAMANDPMGTSSPQHENHGPSTRKPRSPSAARDTGMTKPHTMSKDSSAVMKKRSAA